MVEPAKGRVQHVADAEIHLQVAGQAVARQSDQRRREVDRGDLGPALRRFQRQHAGAASGIQQTHAAQVVGQPVQQGARASGRGLRGLSPGCG